MRHLLMSVAAVLTVASPAVAGEWSDPCKPSGTCPVYIPVSAKEIEANDRRWREFLGGQLPERVRGFMPIMNPPTYWEDHVLTPDPEPGTLFPWAVRLTGPPNLTPALRRPVRYREAWLSIHEWGYEEYAWQIKLLNEWLRVLAKRKNIRVPEPDEE